MKVKRDDERIVDRGFPPANGGIVDIDAIATALTLSAACFWDADLRTIPTFVARMSQMAQDACATLVLINALQGVSMRRGTSAPQARP